MDEIYWIVIGIGGLIIGLILGYFIFKRSFKRKDAEAEEKAKLILKRSMLKI